MSLFGVSNRQENQQKNLHQRKLVSGDFFHRKGKLLS